MSDESPETDRRPPSWQFSLRTVFLVFLVVASGIGALGGAGIFAAALVVAIAGYVRFARTRPYSWAWIVAVLPWGFIALGIVLLWPAVEVAREAARRASCLPAQTALALLNYHDVHSCFPPAFVADENGKPMHSWRVLILPYIEEKALYDACDFSEPWDGPKNAKVAQTFLRLFRCPNEHTAEPVTNYVAIVGPDTMWPGPEGVSLDDIPDGAADTILLIEWPGSDIRWMEPRDVSFEELCGAASRGRLQGAHDVGGGWFHHAIPVINVAMANGRVRSLPAGISAEQLAALLTRNGGEPIDWDALEFRPALNWGRILALVMFALSSLWLIARPPSNVERRKHETR